MNRSYTLGLPPWSGIRVVHLERQLKLMLKVFSYEYYDMYSDLYLLLYCFSMVALRVF